MSNSENINTGLYLIIGLIAIIILLAFIVWLALFIKEFKKNLQYINMEIERSDGSERRYWLRQRRRLWLSLIPFVK